jgi:hypothetical protein
MPAWFDPRWLAQEESPINQMLREMGDPAYQNDDTWLGRPFDTAANQPLMQASTSGGSGDEGGGQGGGGGKRRTGGDGGDEGGQEAWGGMWREDDPYWMLRDWGSHPMRWWTLGFAGLMAGAGSCWCV